MKGVKGRLLKKLKSIPQVTAGSLHFDVRLLPDPARVFRDISNAGLSGGGVKAGGLQCEPSREDIHISRGFVDDLGLLRPPDPVCTLRNDPCEGDAKEGVQCDAAPAVPELPREIEDDDLDDADEECLDKDGYPGQVKAAPLESPSTDGDPLLVEKKRAHGSPRKSSLFRRPRLDTPTLFDPDLLAAFQKAVADYRRACEEFRDSCTRAAASAAGNPQAGPADQQPLPSDPGCCSSHHHPLDRFEQRCPPGGADAVVLYTTSLRGIRKTFEDCSRVRHLLRSLRVAFYERDVSMHAGFRDVMWAALGGGRVIPPRLFVRGRYVGGADDVVGLHERGELMPLMDGMVLPAGAAGSGECGECGGFMFLLCSECRGCRKVYAGGRSEATPEQCQRCNENGLVVCSQCSMAADAG